MRRELRKPPPWGQAICSRCGAPADLARIEDKLRSNKAWHCARCGHPMVLPDRKPKENHTGASPHPYGENRSTGLSEPGTASREGAMIDPADPAAIEADYDPPCSSCGQRHGPDECAVPCYVVLACGCGRTVEVLAGCRAWCTRCGGRPEMGAA